MQGIVGKYVLILEDNDLIGLVIAEAVESAGGHPLGPFASDDEALCGIEEHGEVPDAAVLDLCLNDDTMSVAYALKHAGVPFIFASGYSGAVPTEFADIRFCFKPYTERDLLQTLAHAIQDASAQRLS